jgi:carboxymethylenebutenolidase
MGQQVDLEPGTGAYLAGTGSSGLPVLLLHAWWGLNQDIMDLADRLAGDGFVVVAPDMFEGVVADTIEAAEAHIEAMEEPSDRVLATANLGLNRLLEEPGLTSDRVGVVGLSFGASYGQWVLPLQRPEIGAVVSFYAGVGFEQPTGPAGEPVKYLGHFAADDPFEDGDPAEVAPFHEQLTTTDPGSGAYLYPGTQHWFFEPGRPEYDPEAAQLAYQRTVEFLRAALSTAGDAG